MWRDLAPAWQTLSVTWAYKDQIMWKEYWGRALRVGFMEKGPQDFVARGGVLDGEREERREFQGG